jgi:DNA replication protein DnaC
MERTQLFDLMGELKLYGMKAAFDEIMATAVKRQHEPQRIVGDLLNAEVSEKQARSIKYQLTIAKLPLAKDLDGFEFDGTPINETLVNDLAGGDFIAQQRNVVLVGGTGTGKSHLAIAIARSCIRSGSRGRFYNVVDLVNRLETEARNGRQGRLADHLTRLDFIVLDELGYLPFAQSGGQLLFHLDHRHHQPRVRRMAKCLRRRQDDHRTARSPDPPLRDCGDRQRQLALQKPGLTTASRSLATALLEARSLAACSATNTATKGSKLHADRGSNLDAD